MLDVASLLTDNVLISIAGTPPTTEERKVARNLALSAVVYRLPLVSMPSMLERHLANLVPCRLQIIRHTLSEKTITR